MWPAWWMVGNGDKYKLWWPTVGEIDILEMIGANKSSNSTRTNQCAHAAVHWNNESNTMHSEDVCGEHQMSQCFTIIV